MPRSCLKSANSASGIAAPPISLSKVALNSSSVRLSPRQWNSGSRVETPSGLWGSATTIGSISIPRSVCVTFGPFIGWSARSSFTGA